MKPFFALAALFVLAGCQQFSSPKQPSETAASNAPLVRDQTCGRRMCTMQYEPVCATINYNGQLQQHTFGNSCSVCSDLGKIVSVTQGTCGISPLK